MSEDNFEYRPADDGAGLPPVVSVFADRAHLRDQLSEDAEAAGFRIGQCGEVALLLEGEGGSLGEIVLLDCPQVDAGSLAALSRLDMRAAQSGAYLVIATSVDALDDVISCIDRSNPEILVDPGRVDWVIAMGHVWAKLRNLRLCDLSKEDRLTLLRLTEQVGQIAERLEKMSVGAAQSSPALSSPAQASPAQVSPGNVADSGVFRLESPGPEFKAQGEDGPGDGSERLVRAARPPLPDPRLMRRIIRQRQLRARFFDGDLFADPAWDMLLDLTAARVEHSRVSVTSLCIASGVPPTTALRWIAQMSDAGLLERVEDEIDRRRAFITLTDKAADAMARYFAELGTSATRLV